MERFSIITKKNFPKVATQNDEESLQNCFQAMPGFHVEPVKKDLSLSGLKKFGEQLEGEDFSIYNAVLVFVISHGRKGDNIVSSDKKKYKIKDLVHQHI